MVNKFEVEGFDAFVKQIESLKASGHPTYVLFSGSVDSASGRSWCPDCVVAAPIIQAALDQVAHPDCNFLYVGVGPREFWKDPKNSFRKDPRTRLNSVPTLMKYGTPQRLEESQCAKPDMVEMLFEDA